MINQAEGQHEARQTIKL